MRTSHFGEGTAGLSVAPKLKQSQHRKTPANRKPDLGLRSAWYSAWAAPFDGATRHGWALFFACRPEGRHAGLSG
ncbi:MAG: hypothetical protein ACWGMZ_09570 [Thermoguttaceae bacterium]